MGNSFTLKHCSDSSCSFCNYGVDDKQLTRQINAGKQEVKQETLEKLSKIKEDIENSGNGKYLKFDDGTKHVLQFDPDQTKIIFKKFTGSSVLESETQDDSDFKKFYRFAVYDPNTDKDLTWDCSNWKAASDVVKHLEDGIFFLKIKRIGSDKNTLYDVEPATG